MKIGKRILLLTIVGAALGVQAPGYAEVSVKLSQTSVTLGQPLQLTLESTGTSVLPPDLSVLEQDFQIINHSVRQQAAVRNGYRTQRSMLTLTLLPKRSGSLEIPAIAFGNERSAAQSVTVLAPSGQDAQASTPTPSWPAAQNPWDAFNMPPAVSDPSDPVFNPGSPAFDPSYPSVAPPLGRTGPAYDTPPLGDWFPGRPSTGSTAPSAQSSSAEPASAQESREPRGGYPGWVVALLALGWLGTLGLLWARRRPKSRVPGVEAAEPVSAPPDKPKSETAEESAIRAVRFAYQQQDAEAARTALLQWARAVWPNEAPNNLPRLAERTDEPLRSRIRKLDKAFYSPTPVDWHDDPVWELLPRSGRQSGILSV